ncbi:OB-fold nucleic acid binding domain-containing protein [Streptomyces goshikiensis]|uniref:OB-fold nucleic acid binding domain-containing protein n=1 Tax=Streptomyces goshikiensis TaxID=1942 RepID=UPI00371C9562
MDKARLFQDGLVGARVYAHEIADEPWWRRERVPLVCLLCTTPVVSQRAPVGRARRNALFRLAAGRTHEDVCPLNPTEIQQKIARGSQGVAVISGDELHLLLPGDLTQIDIPTGVDDDSAGAGDHVGVDIATVRPLLPPLINSAVVIARFLQKHDFDPAVVARFKVRRPGKNTAVAWSEFCHGPSPEDQARLYARLTTGPNPTHPVALYGRVTSVSNDSRHTLVLRLADGNGFTVRIRSDHPSLLAPLTVGDYVLAVGPWKVWTPDRGRPELQMFAEEHWQLAHWTYDDTTGHSGPPACPPPLSLAQRTLRQVRTAAAAPKPAPGPANTTASPPSSTSAVPRSLPTTFPPAPVPAAAPTPPPLLPAATPPTPVTPTPPSVPPMPAPAMPELPPAPAVPPRPTVPPQPTSPPPTRTRRSWWPFGR